MISFDTRELSLLSGELPRLGVTAARQMDDVVQEAGADLRDLWARNAEATAGEHGKHYPKSIEARRGLSTSFVVEVGPNPGMPQGGMSFEFGSANQPPHLDGQRALDEVAPAFVARVESVLGLLGL